MSNPSRPDKDSNPHRRSGPRKRIASASAPIVTYDDPTTAPIKLIDRSPDTLDAQDSNDISHSKPDPPAESKLHKEKPQTSTQRKRQDPPSGAEWDVPINAHTLSEYSTAR